MVVGYLHFTRQIEKLEDTVMRTAQISIIHKEKIDVLVENQKIVNTLQKDSGATK